jgi:proline-specific peptidase
MKVNNMERMIEMKNGHSVWTRTVGQGSGIPLLLLHGGPGAGHDYLEPLQALGDERPVIFYDQLGCGKSDIPDNRALWTIERFCDEVDAVRAALGLERCHILGQSWGGWLLVEYMLGQPTGVDSIVLASTSASIPEFTANCDRLIAELPKRHRDALAYHGARGEFEHPAYEAAAGEFYGQHVCRLADWPDCILRTVENLHNNVVYETINGPNEFTTIGNLRYWDRSRDLGQISTPTLITCGRYDELGPSCAATLQAGLPNAKTVIFENSAHVSHIEEKIAYLASLRKFLSGHDGIGEFPSFAG